MRLKLKILIVSGCLVSLTIHGQDARPSRSSAERQHNPKFSSIEYYRNIYRNSKATLSLPSDKARINEWRQKVAEELREVLGLRNSKPVDLNPQVTEIGQRKGYRIQRIVFSSELYADVPGLLLIPDGVSAANPAPAILCLHGNTPGAKDELAGEVISNPEAAEGLALYGDDYAREFALRGFITFAIDLRDSGERQHWERYEGPTFPPENPRSQGRSHQWYWRETSGLMAIPLGRSYLGLCVFDAMRALDYLETRPEVKKGLLASVGFSAGGTLTSLLTTLDRRVKVAGISGSGASSRKSISDSAHIRQASSTVPGFYTHLDWDLCIAANAPTPMVMVRDRRGTNRVTPKNETIAQAYDLFGATENLNIVYGRRQGHVWHGEIVVPWVEQHLRQFERGSH